MPKIEVQIFPETQAALEKDLTLRCIIRAKYHHEKSRRSAIVIPWAKSLAERISDAMIQKIGHPTAGFSTQLNMIQMLGLRNITYICYDLFLDECDEELRAGIYENPHMRRPIHLITRKDKIFIIRRDERADERVFRQYLAISESDKGPRPLFSDLQHPPVYEDGRRLIEYEERTSRQLPPWWRQGENGHRPAWTPEEGEAETSEDGEQHGNEKDGNQDHTENEVIDGNLGADRNQDGLRENDDLRSA